MSLSRRLLHATASTDVTPQRWRRHLLPHLGIYLHPTALLFPGFRKTGDAPLQIGAHSFVNADCTFDASASITIGERVSLGNRVIILTSAHEYGDPRQRGGPRRLLPVRVDDGAWLGAAALVLPGVHVAAGAVVAAGSVVTKDCAAHGLYAGVPARRLRDLPTGDPAIAPDGGADGQVPSRPVASP